LGVLPGLRVVFFLPKVVSEWDFGRLAYVVFFFFFSGVASLFFDLFQNLVEPKDGG
jgi:hypothetical protein